MTTHRVAHPLSNTPKYAGVLMDEATIPIEAQDRSKLFLLTLEGQPRFEKYSNRLLPQYYPPASSATDGNKSHISLVSHTTMTRVLRHHVAL